MEKNHQKNLQEDNLVLLFVKNMLWTTSLAIFAIFIGYLYIIKWIPFENYKTSAFALSIDVMWMYGGLFIAIGLFTIALYSNYFTAYFLNTVLPKWFSEDRKN